MTKRVRLFIAIDVRSTPTLRKLVEQLKEMGRPLKPVSVEQMHVTLKFLGDTDPGAIPNISRAVSESVAHQDAFEMPIAGLGVFPHLERPSVVWAGLENTEPLERIAEELEERMTLLGFPEERRKFHPHLTLARVRARPPEELFSLLEEHRETRFGNTEVREVTLYQSELSSEGPRYTVLSSAELGA